ncbi:ABC transporter ATP-binding protein [Clostridium senegalense]|uniref:ABC transporter ATP-binding protein n=1 Tax=Clostridium senegalense TaxID=1465809 RepID=A0A6M0H604_9CLOT|nr:ABC transporter ATP-binding protein [Clostridium senegalense]NEU06145.1 ABC transporter ATP-binding protein [Clostridium senegalense]
MLEIKDLVKSYGSFKAVDNLNLHVKKGEIFGFVGPNGAGKTTTMKIVSGLLDCENGEVFIDGVDAIKNRREVKRKIGYMPDFFGVYDDLKVDEYLEFYASIYGIEGKEKDELINDLLELVNLSHKKDAYVDDLSRGMKQRLCLARCLVHNPSLLILDEPASGMDPKARIEMKNILRTLKEMGKTIIISSHILPELAELCTNLVIIQNGKAVTSGTVEEVMDKAYKTKFIRLKVLKDVESAIKLLKEYVEIGEIKKIGSNVATASFSGSEEVMCNILEGLIKENIKVVSFNTIDGNLEEVFMKVIGGDDNEK